MSSELSVDFIDRAGFDVVDQLSMVNVAAQVETLAGHPLVIQAREQRPLNVFGLFYDIASAGVLAVTPTSVETLGESAPLHCR